jgi:hypothetical protein
MFSDSPCSKWSARLAGLAAALVLRASADPVPQNPFHALPTLEPVPSSVYGLRDFVVSLDGTWTESRDPQDGYWKEKVEPKGWTDVTVPVPVQLRINREDSRATKPYAYRRTFTVPLGFAGKRVILRFEGVSNDARVWVNGSFVRGHWGTYMAWSCDITNFVTPGGGALIAVGVDDRAIGLAQFVRPGGITRSVRIFAVPSEHLTRFHVETTFDSQYRDATLSVRLKMAFAGGGGAGVKLRLTGGEGTVVPLAPETVYLSPGAPETVARIPVSSPLRWDAEHPNLYTLDATVVDAKGYPLETLSRRVGFREVKVVGNRMLVNGAEVKLRGIWGNSDVAGLKEINVNSSRQKYVTESFLDDADRLGLYVLDEVPVDFAKYGPESDPQCAEQWLSLISDEMERDGSHPSVVIWGLGNESFHGANVLKTFHFAQFEDHQRPEIFSWANRVPTSEELPYSIYSVHYPNLNDPHLNLGDYNVALWHSPSLVRDRNPRPVMPVLQDEYAHVILNDALIIRDPNVRNFWGESIYRYWEKIFVTPGALGGDQFGMGLRLGRGNLPGGPEYFLLKEAYSPVRVDNRPLPNPGAGRALPVAVKDWYDHTNLSELRVLWSAGGDHGELRGPSVEAHGSGTLTLPARSWRGGDEVHLKFVESSGHVANEFDLVVEAPIPSLPRPRGPAPRLEETDAEIIVTGPDFRVVFDKYRGLMKEASVGGANAIIDGPFLTLSGSGLAYGEWWCDALSAHSERDEVVVDIKGNYAVIAASFRVRIDGRGLITTRYTIDHVPGKPPPPTFSPWNATSVGGYSDVGISYMLPGNVDRLSWARHALWSAYPSDHIGRPAGIALREPSAAPGAPWSRLEDPAGAGSNDWRAMKENIVTASAWAEGAGAAVTALSDGSNSVRLLVDPGYRALKPGIRMLVDNDWNYEDFGLGNYVRPPLLMADGYTNTVYLQLEARR